MDTHSVIDDEFVHAAWTQRRAHGIDHCHARIDVADQLRLALACVRALPQEDDRRLLHMTRALCASL
jgi:hypothetical protein